MKKLLTLSFFLLSMMVFGQQIPLDTWRSHFSYNSARLLAKANNTLFCSAESGLFTVDINTLEKNVISKEHGLSDVTVSALHFSSTNNVLIIGYESGAIDLIDEKGSIHNLLTFRDAPIIGDKRIKDIESIGSNAYLATPVGILKLNLANKTVIENYRNIGSGGQPVSALEVVIKNDSLYAITSVGIQVGNIADNLLDFNDWFFFPETNTGTFKELILSDNSLMAVRNQTELWKYNGSVWEWTGIDFPSPIRTLYTDDRVYALAANNVYSVDPLPVSILSDTQLINGSNILRINGTFWISDSTNGLLRFDQNTQVIIPDGPLNNQPSRIRVIDQHVYALFGPAPSQYNGTSDGLGYSVFTNGRWSTDGLQNFSNITDVAATSYSLYFSSMGDGLYEMASETILDHTNSALKQGNSFSGVQISGIESHRGQIWALSYNAPDALYQLQPDQSIEAFTPSQTGFNRAENLSISSEGLIWAIKSSLEGNGIGIYDPQLDQRRTLRSSDGLPSSVVSDIAIDTDDEAWIGTNNGIANFSSASYPFNSFGASIPIFQNGYLLEDEVITAVMADGGDRIWIGTNDGVWVLSKDLTQLEHRFTTENSPLPDNLIESFAYEGKSGEVFIRTSKGLVSYRSSSSQADIVHSPNIDVFPNPARIGVDSVIGINGLARNANVRITDTLGRLVKELNAVGGTASWNLDTFLGTKVAPGIYLVFSSSSDGVDTFVGKIAILR
jgi:ligand-binding sensor domain-containing protein